MNNAPEVFQIQKELGTAKVTKKLNEYYSLFDNKDHSTPENERLRKENYYQLTLNYYDLATDFYEYGWGESFHFGPRHKNESTQESIARAEMYVALRLGLQPGMRVLDVGCGVGGPMRTISRFSGCVFYRLFYLNIFCDQEHTNRIIIEPLLLDLISMNTN